MSEHLESERITSANSLSAESFRQEYFHSAVQNLTPSRGLALSLETPSSIAESDLMACFELVRLTSVAAYEASTMGWSSKDKLKEMRLADMKYLLLKKQDHDAEHPGAEGSTGLPTRMMGFASFMMTEEDELEVVYCYEIHLHPEVQGQGLGPRLMEILESIGKAVGMEISMLTVFTSNVMANRVYKRLGYEWYDEEPVPAPRRLRSRETVQAKPTYVILAKELR